jgi:hypothetical protein
MKIFMTAASFVAATQHIAGGLADPLQPWSTQDAIEATRDHSLSVSNTYTFSLDLTARGKYVVEQVNTFGDAEREVS